MEFPFQSDRSGYLYLLGDSQRKYIIPTSDPHEAVAHQEAEMILLHKLPLEGLTFEEVQRVTDGLWEQWQREKPLSPHKARLMRWVQNAKFRFRLWTGAE